MPASAHRSYRILGMICRAKFRRLTIVLSLTILAITVLSFLSLEFNTDFRRSTTIFKVSESGSSRYLQIVDENVNGQSADDVVSFENGRRRRGGGGGRRRRSIRNVFFLKVHKCASSTVQNILMRYGQARGLNFVLPPYGNYLGVPELLNVAAQALPLSSASSSMTSRSSSMSIANNYNVLCHHCRFNEASVRESMPPDTLRLAIVRDPVDLFESLYSYCDLADVYQMSIDRFVSMPRRWFSTLARVHDVIGTNQMAFDFGLSTADFTDAKKVDEAIRLLDEQFHLVMVAEHFDESIVLMKNLLQLDVQDVVYFTRNKRFTEEKQNLTDKVRRRIRDANWIDQLIYDHFLSVFRQKVADFGEERMRAEADDLRRWNRHWYRTCGVRSSRRNDDDDSLPTAFREITAKVQALTLDTDRLIRNNPAHDVELCETLAIAELPFTTRLRSAHIKRHGTWWQNLLNSMGFYER